MHLLFLRDFAMITLLANNHSKLVLNLWWSLHHIAIMTEREAASTNPTQRSSTTADEFFT